MRGDVHGTGNTRYTAAQGRASRLAVHPSLPPRPLLVPRGPGTGRSPTHTRSARPGKPPPRSRVASTPFGPSRTRPAVPLACPSSSVRPSDHVATATDPSLSRIPIPEDHRPPVTRSGSHVFHATRVASPTGWPVRPCPAPTARRPTCRLLGTRY
jgi:hypothetical protein